MPEPEYLKKEVFVLYVNNIEILCDDEEFVYDKTFTAHLIYQAVEKNVNPLVFQQMKYKGIVGAWKKTEVNTPAVKLLSIVRGTHK
jgi:hypothetical protein